MIDGVLITTPLVVLALLLLLGYAGCKFDTSGTVTTGPFDPPGFYIAIRVPPAITATEITYDATTPEGDEPGFGDNSPTVDHTENGFDVYTHYFGPSIPGTWTASCQVEVAANGAQDARDADGDASPDSSDELVIAWFEVEGTPSQADFDVNYTGWEGS